MPVTSMTFRTTLPRRKPREGDVKVDKNDVRWVRRQEMRRECGGVYYVVNNGKPSFVWVREDA